MRKIGIAISKGGTAKTTSAANVAHGLARRGHKVALIDLDTQGQVKGFFGVEQRGTMAALVKGVPLADCLVEVRDNLHLMTGGPELAELEEWISTRTMKREMVLSEFLQPLEDMKFDFVILDTAPGWNALNVNLLFYVEELLCPVKLEAMSMDGLKEFIGHLGQVQQYRADLKMDYVVPTFLDRRENQCGEVLEILQNHFKSSVTMPIPKNVRLGESFGQGQTIYEYAPDCPGAYAYNDLTDLVESYVRK
ncbi:ParA family protein [Maridesulfovibrio sp.]|uniref:ParA family protein n=1 Tax=Maridesulfovibrio sp. TaxID=2795000 RepID=UPI0029CA6F03|nr:ParA family protein [Maridesulfovibrio sp.]